MANRCLQPYHTESISSHLITEVKQCRAGLVHKKEELEEKENDAYGYNSVVRGTSLKDHIGRVGKRIEMILSRMTYHNIKVLLLHIVKY